MEGLHISAPTMAAAVAALLCGPNSGEAAGQLWRDSEAHVPALEDESIPCVDAFFAHLPELNARPITLTAPGGSSGLDLPGQSELTRVHFRAAEGALRACTGLRGRYFGVRGLLPEDAAALQGGAAHDAYFGVCAPPQCSQAEVGSILAPVVAQITLMLDTTPRLVGPDGSLAPEIEELGSWSELHVDFVIAGFAKCGTTALAAYLHRHANLRLGDVEAGAPYFEDTFFLSSNLLPSSRDIKWFTSRHGGKGALYQIGIKYPHLLFRDLALLKLQAVNPFVRLILLVRDPIDWLESTYRWYVVANATPPPTFVEHALSVDPRQSGLRTHWIEAHFAHWVKRLWRLGFARQQVYITHVDGVDHEAAARLCGWLGVPGAPPGSMGAVNVNTRSTFDLCAVAAKDNATREALRQLKADFWYQYQELQALLAENGEPSPTNLRLGRSRCERTG